MEISIEIDPKRQEPKVVVITAEVTDEVTRLVARLSSPPIINGYDGNQLFPLPVDGIVRIYTDGQKVIAETPEQKRYTLKSRLYTLEEQLQSSGFIRVSHSEIANMKKVRAMDLSLSGNITLIFQNGVTTFVSRRQMKRIKAYLHL